MSLEDARELVHSLIVALSVVQAALLAIEKLLQSRVLPGDRKSP